MVQDATAETISSYCQYFSKQSLEPSCIENDNASILPCAQAFSDALSASNAICAIVRDWPTNSIIRTSPFIIGGLLAPAIIQMLAKTFSGRASNLAEKASVSLQSLAITIEHMAEYWGLCRCILGM
jgi:hypothetical protein